MEDLKQQDQIIYLGKLLVKELGLENSDDTLSRWMAHFLAEKISLVERLPESIEKENAQKECFEIILKLWESRWELPSGRRLLENFRPILNVLEKINPENREPFFYRQASRVVETDKVSNIDEINKYIETIEQIDKVTRIWIDFLLQQAISKAKNENTETIFKNILPIFCNNDLDAIQILINDVEFFEENNKKDILQKRIEELEKFAKLNEFMLAEYRKDLSNLEK